MTSLLTPQKFTEDDGSADPELTNALQKFASDATDLEPVVEVLSRARVLIPVVAVLGETGESPLTGLVGDKNADMALVLLRSSAGRPGLPVFTCVDSMRRWNSQARPVPVETRRAALSAVDEGCDIIVIDPAGPVTAVLSRPAVWALAQARRWVPSPRDPEVTTAVEESVGELPQVIDVRCCSGRGAELRIECELQPGLDRAGLDATTEAISQRIGSLSLVAERVASVELKLL